MAFPKRSGLIKKIRIVGFLIASALPFVSFASANCSSSGGGLCNPLKVNSIQELLVAVLGYLVQVGTVIIVLMMVYIGFEFVLARGNPTKLQKAREMLLWTIIGALIILGAQAISMGIASTITAISAS